MRTSVGKGYVLREGTDAAIFAMGSVASEALKAAEHLQKERQLSVAVVDMPTVKPIDRELIIDYGKKCKLMVSIEEHSIYCGLGSAIAEIVAEEGLGVPLKRLGLESCVDTCANRKDLREHYHLDSRYIVEMLKT